MSQPKMLTKEEIEQQLTIAKSCQMEYVASVCHTALALMRQRDRAETDRAALLEVCKAMSDLYVYAWDLVDGGLMMMADSGVPAFEEAHGKCQAAIVAAESPDSTSLLTGREKGSVGE